MTPCTQRCRPRRYLAAPWLSIWRYELSSHIAKSVAYSLLAAGVQLGKLDCALGPPLDRQIGSAPSDALVSPPTPRQTVAQTPSPSSQAPVLRQVASAPVSAPISGLATLIGVPAPQTSSRASSSHISLSMSSQALQASCPDRQSGTPTTAHACGNASSVATGAPGCGSQKCAPGHLDSVGLALVDLASPQHKRMSFAGSPLSASDNKAACPLTEIMLMAARPGIQKQLIGQRLYPAICERHPECAHPETVGLITGILLDKSKTVLMEIVRSPQLLGEAISEALAAHDFSRKTPFCMLSTAEFAAAYEQPSPEVRVVPAPMVLHLAQHLPGSVHNDLGLVGQFGGTASSSAGSVGLQGSLVHSLSHAPSAHLRHSPVMAACQHPLQSTASNSSLL